MRTPIAVWVVSVCLLICGGCATSEKMNRLSIGMDKAAVIAAMGAPASTASPGSGIEVLRYNLGANRREAYRGDTEEFYVRLVAGKVDSYGKVGDFDTAQRPTVNVNVKPAAP